jgi:hypothetical protein
VAADKSYQYYWVRRERSKAVPRISLVTVQTDEAGRVLAQRVVVSS